MNKAIIYRSFLGTTKNYANWLGQAVGAKVYTMSEMKGKKLADFDLIVTMSGTYAGWMPLVGYLKRNWKYLQGKEVVAVAVGAAPADDPWSKTSYLRIPSAIRDKVAYFKLPGRDPGKKEATERTEDLAPVEEKVRMIELKNIV